MMRLSRRAALIFLLFLLLPGPGVEAFEEQDAPTRITSERLCYSHHDNRIEFIGTVRVDRPGFEMRSERLLVFLQTVRRDDGVGDGSREPGQELDSRVEVEKMIAQGQVYLRHGGRVGRSETATYWVDREVLRLEGNAVVEEGPTRLEGSVITLHAQDKELDVLGRPERRVEGVFFLPREESR